TAQHMSAERTAPETLDRLGCEAAGRNKEQARGSLPGVRQEPLESLAQAIIVLVRVDDADGRRAPGPNQARGGSGPLDFPAFTEDAGAPHEQHWYAQRLRREESSQRLMSLEQRPTQEDDAGSRPGHLVESRLEPRHYPLGAARTHLEALGPPRHSRRTYLARALAASASNEFWLGTLSKR